MTTTRTTFVGYPDTVDHFAIEAEARRLRAETVARLVTALLDRLMRRASAQGRGRTA